MKKFNLLYFIPVLAITNLIAQTPNNSEILTQDLADLSTKKHNDIFFNPKNAKLPFNKMFGDLNDQQIDDFIIGRSFFSIPWVEAPSATTARDGLGPLFNANTCASCHVSKNDHPMNEQDPIHRSNIAKLSMPYKYISTEAISKNNLIPPQGDPHYGLQISINGTSDVPKEAEVKVKFNYSYYTFHDGQKIKLRTIEPILLEKNYGELDPKTSMGIRITPVLVGIGLVDRIKDEDILAGADPDDNNNDGISGKANFVLNPQTKKIELGRFGYKASQSSSLMQSADAAFNDMGLTSAYFPQENCSSVQTECINAPRGRTTYQSIFDLTDQRLKGIAFYINHQKAPYYSPDYFQANGFKIFNSIGCSQCHKVEFTTTDNIKFNPFSDFLLHDMGENLADKREEFLASGSEFRTIPLWGMGAKLKANIPLLHDGRATSIIEAILWHGGEAEAAATKFKHLSEKTRNELITFIENL